MEQVKGYDYKADIWSFGITAIELATGTAPYHKYPPMKVLMLTLQNEPPSLDSGAEDKEQYKQQYGKTFRKMIGECLQKDPSKRPTAAELLKNQFFKNKAKDKNYLQKNLVASAPNIDARVQKAKTAKRPGTSGRLHRNEVGEWVWSSDEDDGEQGRLNLSKLGNFIQFTIFQPLQGLTQSLNFIWVCTYILGDDKKGAKSTPSPADGAGQASGKADTSAAGSVEPNSQDVNAQILPNNQRTLSIVLRMRNPRRELNDIRFEYQPTKDTTDGIANELLSNGLIAQNDVQIMSNSMLQLVENPPPSRVITFRVSTGFAAEDSPDERNLLGYAQLSLGN